MIRHFILLLTFIASLLTGAQAQILYKISGNGLPHPSYLFGTHHLAPRSILDSVPSAKAALDEVKTVVGEIDMVNTSQLEMMTSMKPLMTAPADSTLSKLLTPAEFAEADSLFNNVVHMRLEMFDAMRPIVPQLVVMTLLAANTTGADVRSEQLDSWFQSEAKRRGLGIGALETYEEQAQVLYTFTPLEIQAANLLKMLRNPEETLQSVEALTDAYMARDINRLEALSKEQTESADDAAFINALLVNRNNNWIAKMPEMMNASPTLFVVGALHLPGSAGLISSLRDKGYEVTAIME